ncbi:MAG: hypothetical protein ABI216_04205 [Devosia sp.]
MHARCGRSPWTLEFEAIRAGELLRWACTAGLVKRCVVQGEKSWRLLDRRMHFMCIGAAAHPRAICILGPNRDPDADRLIKRELRRRERARAKLIADNRISIERMLNGIGRDDPSMEVPDELAHLAVPGIARILELRQVLLDEVEAHRELTGIVWRARVLAHDREVSRPEPLPISAEDLEAFDLIDF